MSTLSDMSLELAWLALNFSSDHMRKEFTRIGDERLLQAAQYQEKARDEIRLFIDTPRSTP
jgi:hypothetical protein